MGLGACTRGCGKRVAGGIYAECPLGPFGYPLEHYLLEPPVVIEPDALGLSPVGVQLLQRGDTWHVLDWVGEEHYPNVADMVEEIRQFGMSRRLPKTLDFEKLGPNSRVLLVHRRAYVDNWQAYLRARAGEAAVDSTARGPWSCRKRPEAHTAGKLLDAINAAGEPEMCIATWYHDLDEVEPNPDGVCVSRVVGDTQYDAYLRPAGIQPIYRVAIFATLPLANLCVVANPEDAKQEAAAMKAASAAKVPVTSEVE